MELTTRHKAYGTVLGLALTGFAVDRLFFSGQISGPSSAEAGEAGGAVDASVAPTAAAHEPLHSDAHLAQRMSRLREGVDRAAEQAGGVGNAFVPTWDLSHKSGNAPTTDAAPAPTAPDPREWLRLTSVVNRRAAVINGVVLQVGQSHKFTHHPTAKGSAGNRDPSPATRVRLLEAGDRSATVRVGDKEFTLALPDHRELTQMPKRRLDDADDEEEPMDAGDALPELREGAGGG